MSVSLRTVGLVAAKELRESLRDRRTLFVALLLPVLLYPLMMLAVAPLVSMQKQKLKDDAQPIAVTGGGAEALRRLVLDGKSAAAAPGGLEVVQTFDPAGDLAEGRISLWIEVADEFEAKLGSEGTAKLTVHYDGSDDRSLAADRKFREALAPVVEAEIARRVAARGLPAEWLEPIRATADQIAPPERRAAYLFGKMLAFILVVLTLSSSFYPAVDAVAGEKERGTMETLLVAPCGRTELVLGKFLAVLVVTLAAATLNLASMGLTMGPLMDAVAPEVGMGIRVTPSVLVGILALLVPLSALFSAVSLALSTLARSVKEGQHYLTPLFLVVMPLAMVVILPNVPLTTALAPLPVTNAVLFFRDLLLGKTEPGTTAIVMVSTFAYAAAALWASVALFLREETLFRGPEGGTALVVRPALRERPGGAAALFLFAVAMSFLWYGQSWLPQDDLVPLILAPQILLILLPCVLLAWWLRASPVATFRFRAPGGLALAAAVAAGLAAPILNNALLRAVGVGEPSEAMRTIEAQMRALVHASPLGAALLIGVLPAVCEELFFRGFLLSGFSSAFRGRGAEVRAVVLTAALFAVFHITPEKWLPTFLMGLLLGFLASRTGSIWPGVLAHAANNTSAVLQEWPPVRDVYAKLPDGVAVPAAAVLVAAAVAALALTSRRGRAAPAPPSPADASPGR
jgi:sodium transport system permease protein